MKKKRLPVMGFLIPADMAQGIIEYMKYPKIPYRPYESTPYDRADEIEQFAVYCLDIELQGNPGVSNYEPPVKFEQYKGICFYDTNRRRRKNDPKMFFLYKNWREVWAERYPDYKLVPAPKPKPKERLTEKEINYLLQFYQNLWNEALEGGHISAKLIWYYEEYSCTIWRHDAYDIEIVRAGTKKEIRDHIINLIKVLYPACEDWFLYNVWIEAMRQMKDSFYCSYGEWTAFYQLSFDIWDDRNMAWGMESMVERNEITFPSREQAANWFKQQIAVLEAWGIKPKTPGYR